MKKALFILSLFIFNTFFVSAQVKVIGLKCENLTNPVGLDVAIPRFSWKIESGKRNTMQSAYEIRVSLNKDELITGSNLIWSSQKTDESTSVFVPYKGPAMTSAQKYYWQVRIWDQDMQASDWSEPAFWQMGLLNSSDWKASWIKLKEEKDTVNQPSPLFRKEFKSKKGVKSAFAYITSKGLYEAQINGNRVGDMYLTPGWTAYKNRIQYQVFDVTNLLLEGNNAAGVSLGSGWFRGNIGWGGNKNFYGKELSLLFQLEIIYEDETSEYVVSDDSWKSSFGAVLNSEIYNGETQDARNEQAGWSKPGFDDKNWQTVAINNKGDVKLIATYNEPVRKREIIKPIKLIKTPEGDQVLDFGQNMVGWVQVKVSGKAGDKIIVSHAEVLDKKGNFYTENLRSAKQQNTFILSGKGIETFEPHFTFQGFRYIKIEGYPGEIDLNNFKAIAVYSDMEKTGEFTCSNPLLNQLQQNIQWGQRGNFVDVPTDCPQRDERLGWTGDAQVFSRTATFNFDVNNFFTKWLKDVAADQQPNGSVPFVVPNVLGAGAGGATGWADVATIIPWNIYLAYGNTRILEEQYASMKQWVKYMEDKSKNDLWNTGFHFGDWLFYRPDDDNNGRAAVTDVYLIAQSFYAHSVQIMINSATVLGKSDDVSYYESLLKRIKKAYLDEYVTPNGRLVSGTQTAYVLALQFDMLPENLRQQAAERLVENIKSYGNHLTTGFLGTPYLCHVLTRFGYTDVAYKLLMQESYPSWLYPVKMGATTIWERWDGIKPDSTFQTPSMNSYNHYAYGAIGDWMYRTVVGIDTYQDLPGYKHIKIKPHIGGGLTHAEASLNTLYGALSSKWVLTERSTNLSITIPPNTRATLFIPCKEAGKIKEGKKAIDKVKDISITGIDGDYTVVEIGSGKYEFSCEK